MSNRVLQQLQRFGDALRAQRKRAGLTQSELARQAGLPRQKLIQVEQGKPGVAVAAYAAVMDVLGLTTELTPTQIRISEYPQLRNLAWNRPGATTLPERDALALYERYWDLIDADQMDLHERQLLQRLVARYGHGVLHV